MRKLFNTKYIASVALLAALTIVVSYLESLIPSIGIPGVKFGFANILILVILYCFGFPYAFVVSLIRVIITSLLIGNFAQMGFFMSLAGAVLSILIMWLTKLFFKKFTLIGVSVLGSLAHITGQIVISIVYLESFSIFYYYPVLVFTSLLTGILVGVISSKILKIKYFSRIIKKNEEKLLNK